MSSNASGKMFQNGCASCWLSWKQDGNPRAKAERGFVGRGNLLQQRQQIVFHPLHLVKCALSRRLVGAPAQQRRAVPKSLIRKMVVANLDDQLWLEWLPFVGPPGALPVKPGGAISVLSFLVSFVFSSRLIADVNPTW